MIRQVPGLALPTIILTLLALIIVWMPSMALAEGHTLQGKAKVYKKGGKRKLWGFDNTVVYLEGIATPPDVEPVAVDQRKKKFLPRILPVVKGQVVRFYNQDRIDHNVFSTEEKNSFDLGRYPKGEYRDQPYDKLGQYKVYCNIHKAMILDVLVVPNRYFSVTDKKGNYLIPDVPAGEYMLKAWHIYGGSAELAITVSDNTTLPELKLVSTRVVREIENHLDKEGKKYIKKKSRYSR